MTIPLESWLEVMRDEYFATFIPEGGSAVRFVVAANPDQADNVSMRLRELGQQCRLTVIDIDTAETKLHLLQNLFFAIARSIDWDKLTQVQLERVVANSGYRWPDPNQRTTLAILAEANEVAPALMRMQIHQEITRVVWQDTHLAQDFRNAMIALLVTRLADDQDALQNAVFGWLQGSPGPLGLLKDAQIGTKIVRNNARAMLRSLCHWLRMCGEKGMLLSIDVTRLLRERRQVADGQFYSLAAVMDCYEVLRQMIDDAGMLEGFFLAVIADPPLLAGDLRRSLNQYTALKMRVWDDVRPEYGDNPLAPLVQLQ
ncbi:MAG: hypothetical protein QOF70_1280 [Acetobacteraceae bacterium]|jgi:hypothetical protein|nr:hypothetical protein [Rhodopila sp.]MEA2726805.1 hypothetical protein [Acetobacteraceae bacterium]